MRKALFLFVTVPLIALTAILGTFEGLGILPETKVVLGKDISNRHLQTLIDTSIVAPSDNIEYFFSDGVFNVLEGGQLLTDNRLVSYEQIDGTLAVYEMPYRVIQKIELLENGDSFNFSSYKIYGNETAEWEYVVIFLSHDEGGDLAFIKALSEKVSKSKRK
ncbi:MAG: hypothetical protein NXI13_01845 [Proteobacteria bacterium]|nr:hypothetical protein [Pseudomonadota bacterium]